jgi:hypothetical protein
MVSIVRATGVASEVPKFNLSASGEGTADWPDRRCDCSPVKASPIGETGNAYPRSNGPGDQHLIDCSSSWKTLYRKAIRKTISETVSRPSEEKTSFGRNCTHEKESKRVRYSEYMVGRAKHDGAIEGQNRSGRGRRRQHS